MKLKPTKKEQSGSFVLNDESSFLMKEDYKSLRTNLMFSFADTDSKVVAVTSSTRSEGKSTNSINLAISCAYLEKKVLLIDCDMRLPTLAKKLKLTNQKGLSDVLVGETSFEEAVIHDQEKGISILTVGTMPPDPTRLLQSARMRELIREMRECYDYIILDCPPVNAVVDAILMVDFVDGYLLLVRHNETDIRELSESLRKLERAKANVLGVVYTNMPVQGKRSYYKNKKYGYYGVD